MKKSIQITFVSVLLLGSLFFSGQFAPVTAKETNIMEFDTMVGVPAGLTGAQSPIRGINGGGLPWVLTAAQGELKSSGKLEIDVRGLVLAAGANTGKNPSANFKVIVSCLKGDGSVENVSSGLFPATVGAAVDGGGNARIETMLPLPQPCIAPIVFITSPAGSWFAATGN